MKLLIDIKTLHGLKASQLIPIECEYCSKTFLKPAGRTRTLLASTINTQTKYRFCTVQCHNLSQLKKIAVNCAECSKSINVLPKEIKKSKSGKSFCSQSCAARWNNKNKTIGTRRSKLELWLEAKLAELYPTLQFVFNGKETINSELDIYIPSLQLAFELNGIFHYEPIYGAEKLSSIKNNDERKFQACLEKMIELVIIDTSNQKYFKEKTSMKYLDIISDIINHKLQ